MERKTFFTVQGKPFYSLGIQTHNSSSSTPEYLQYSWNAAKKIEANTVAVISRSFCYRYYQSGEGE